MKNPYLAKYGAFGGLERISYADPSGGSLQGSSNADIVSDLLFDHVHPNKFESQIKKTLPETGRVA